MKKIFIILLMLSCFAGAFAETGYANTAWGTPKKYVDLTEETDSIKSKSKTIQGVKTTLYYQFVNDRLAGVCYSIPAEKTEQLKQNYYNLVAKFKAHSTSQKEWIKMLQEDSTTKEKLTAKSKDLMTSKILFLSAWDIENNGYDQLKDVEGKGNFYIYDYNNDTRVYIFENTIEGITFVVYTYHEQDF